MSKSGVLAIILFWLLVGLGFKYPDLTFAALEALAGIGVIFILSFLIYTLFK